MGVRDGRTDTREEGRLGLERIKIRPRDVMVGCHDRHPRTPEAAIGEIAPGSSRKLYDDRASVRSASGVSSVFFRLTPRNDDTFTELFVASATHLTEGARLLAGLLAADADGRPHLAARMRDIEHQADEATHLIVHRVNSAFVTPFDRADIHALAARLDDCMDHMDRAVDLIDVYEIDHLPRRSAAQIDVIARMAELTVLVLPALRDRERVREYVVEINRLENQAEREHRRLRAHLLAGEATEVLDILKLLGVVDELEAVCNAFEKLAHAVEVISLKAS